jgi:hypothetical protein
MIDYLDTTSSDYIEPEDTNALQLESDKAEVNVEEKTYGINKPYRITIRAKISHDKD